MGSFRLVRVLTIFAEIEAPKNAGFEAIALAQAEYMRHQERKKTSTKRNTIYTDPEAHLDQAKSQADVDRSRSERLEKSEKSEKTTGDRPKVVTHTDSGRSRIVESRPKRDRFREYEETGMVPNRTDNAEPKSQRSTGLQGDFSRLDRQTPSPGTIARRINERIEDDSFSIGAQWNYDGMYRPPAWDDRTTVGDDKDARVLSRTTRDTRTDNITQ